MGELVKRVLVAIVGIPLAMLIIYFGGIYLMITVLVISSIALWEFYQLAEKKGSFPKKIFGIISNVIIIVTLFLFLTNHKFSWFWIILTIELILIMLITISIELWSGKRNSLYNVSVMFAGMIYITLAFSTILGIREINLISEMIQSHIRKTEFISNMNMLTYGIDKLFGAYLLMILFFTIWICDTAAYFIGKAFGKHKLFPRVSPKKSWEGSIAGFIGSIASFTLFSLWLLPKFPIIHSIILGVLIGIISQVGDLGESLFKRDAGVKDSSTILPGHGGMLDRFDSIIFSAPVLFIYLVIFGIISF